MTLTNADLPAASAAAARLVVAPSAVSTNSDLVAAVAEDPGAWPHLSVLVTDDQTAGRGRLDRSWTAAPGTALAISLVVHAHELPVAQRGWISLIAGAAMTRAVAAALRGRSHTVRMKWPNDVLVDGLKIAGVLAEVVPGYPEAIVVGVGVNTRMAAADLPVPTAVSLRALSVESDEDALLTAYLGAFAEQFDALVAAGDASRAGVRAEIEALSATISTDVEVSLPDGTSLAGRAVRIGPAGELVVDAGREVSVFAGDVVHVRPAPSV